MDKPLFDPLRFGAQVAQKIKREGLSYRAAEREAGVDHATIYRVVCGKPPSVEAYLRLIRWLRKGMAQCRKSR